MSLLNNGGEFKSINVIKYLPQDSVIGMKPGDRIRLTRDDFARLSAGVFDELDAKYR